MLFLTSLATALWLSNRSPCHTLKAQKSAFFLSSPMWQPRRRQEKSRRRRLPLLWRLCAQRWSVLTPPHPPKGCSWLITLFNSHPRLAVYEPVAHFWLCSRVGRFGGGGYIFSSLLTFFQILPSPLPSISLSLYSLPRSASLPPSRLPRCCIASPSTGRLHLSWECTALFRKW